MQPFRDAKAIAKSLRAEIRERHQLELSHSESLEIVARLAGYQNWNVLSAQKPWHTGFSATTTIPVLRVFDEAAAKEFYADFLGFTLDWGGPSGGPGTPFYGQVSRPGTTLQMALSPYEAGPGATVDIWLSNLDEVHRELSHYVMSRNIRIWGPGIWMPDIMAVPYGTEKGSRVLVLSDPFGNHLRLSEPNDKSAHLPRWDFNRQAATA
ncbi:glyoxalase superfamily protein [Allorhizocola rhizosphaerae]|uniref:glyoxalase superfamily protein n=1 Tax=Allorhizocola rhizosphaerae TaxID=1872709 RepID=UPI0013C301EA|nr:glyoxalase superfamily protein [Allorhizocola rhizosphaerae]